MTPLGKVVDKCKKMHPDLEALTAGVTLRFGGLQSALFFIKWTNVETAL